MRFVVLERNGSVSVICRDRPLDPWLFDDVPGARRLALSDRPAAD